MRRARTWNVTARCTSSRGCSDDALQGKFPFSRVLAYVRNVLRNIDLDFAMLVYMVTITCEYNATSIEQRNAQQLAIWALFQPLSRLGTSTFPLCEMKHREMKHRETPTRTFQNFMLIPLASEELQSTIASGDCGTHATDVATAKSQADNRNYDFLLGAKISQCHRRLYTRATGATNSRFRCAIQATLRQTR